MKNCKKFFQEIRQTVGSQEGFEMGVGRGVRVEGGVYGVYPSDVSRGTFVNNFSLTFFNKKSCSNVQAFNNNFVSLQYNN